MTDKQLILFFVLSTILGAAGMVVGIQTGDATVAALGWLLGVVVALVLVAMTGRRRRRALLVAALVLGVAGVAHADTLGFVDGARVYSESTVAKRAGDQLSAEQRAKQAEVSQAQTAMTKARANKKAKAADVHALEAKAEQLAKKDQAELNEHKDQIAADLAAQLRTICAAIAKVHHLTYVLPVVPLYAPPGRDYTEEAVKRWNAADVASTAEQLGRATAENASLKAQLAKLKSTAKPSGGAR